VILSNITDDLPVGSVLKIDDTLDFLPVSSNSILAGDVVTVGDTSAVVTQATKHPPASSVQFIWETDAVTLIGNVPVLVGDKLLLNARLGSTPDEGHWLTGEVLTVTSVGSGGIKATASRGGESSGGWCDISNVLFLNKEIIVQSGTEVAVDAVWVGTRSPLTFTGKSEDKTKPVLGKSAVIGDSMFISNGLGKVQKYDGSTVFDAGIIAWNPTCFINTTTSGGAIAPANVPATIAASVVTASAKIPVTLGHETGFLPGDVVEYSSTGSRYTVTGTASDATYGYILINSAITATSGQTLTRITRMRYYARLQYIDRNDNVCISAVTGLYDLDVAISASSNVNFKFITPPPIGVHDFARIELELYRAPQNTSAGFRKVVTKQVYSTEYKECIEITDKLAEPVLANQPIDFWSQAVMTSLGYPASELPVGLTPPPTASQVSVKNNRLLLANIQGERKLDVLFRSKNPGALTPTMLSGYVLTIRRESSSATDSSSVEDVASFEFTNTNASDIDAVSIDSSTRLATITTSDSIEFATGGWVYLFHSASAFNNDIRFSGWYKVVTGGSDSCVIKLTNSDVVTAWGANDVDKICYSSELIDAALGGLCSPHVPVWLGSDYNFAQYYTAAPTTEYIAALRLACAINATNAMISPRNSDEMDGDLFWLKAVAGGSYKPGQVVITNFKNEPEPMSLLLGGESDDFDVFVNGLLRSGGSSSRALSEISSGSYISVGPEIPGTLSEFINISSMTYVGTTLYVAGSYTLGGLSKSGLAKWDGASWVSVTTLSSGNIFSILGVGSTLYVGGNFTSIGGTSANYIAKLVGSTWSALGTGMNTVVRCMATDGTNLYVGGQFTTAGGVAAGRVAKWDGSSWSSLGYGVGDTVYSMTYGSNDVLYIGGDFTTENVSPYKRMFRVAKWNGSEWLPIGTSDKNGANSTVNAIAYIDGSLYIGGEFDKVSGSDSGSPTFSVSANYIARWDIASEYWSAVGDGCNNKIRCFLLDGSTLHIGGDFTTAGGISANRFASLTDLAWEYTAGGPTDGWIAAIQTVGDSLYVGGYFEDLYGEEVEASAKSYPSRLLRSATNFPEVFDSPEATESGSIIDVNASDGQEITAVVPFLGESVLGSSTLLSAVAVFKKNSVYVVDTDTKEVAKIDSRNLGCTGAAYPTSDGVMFVNESGVFKLTRSLKVEPVGLYLQGVFDSLVDKANLASSVASYYPLESKFMLSARSKDSETNDIVFAYHVLGEQAGQDTGGGAWSRYDSVPASSWLVVNDDCYFGGTDGNVYRFYKDDEPSSYNDNGEAITSSVLLRTMDFGYPSIRKKLANVVSHFVVDETMASTVLSFAVDHLDTYTSTQAFVVPEPETGISDLSAHREVAVRSSLERPKFRTLQLKYTNSGLNENMVLTGVEFLVTLMKRKGVQQAAKLQS
jgi:hypothetical protein